MKSILTFYSTGYHPSSLLFLIARFMWPTWGPAGANRAQVCPMLVPWTLLSRMSLKYHWTYQWWCISTLLIYCFSNISTNNILQWLGWFETPSRSNECGENSKEQGHETDKVEIKDCHDHIFTVQCVTQCTRIKDISSYFPTSERPISTKEKIDPEH